MVPRRCLSRFRSSAVGLTCDIAFNRSIFSGIATQRDTRMYVGKHLRKLRESRGLTQMALAAKSGLDIRTCQRAEAGMSVSPSTVRDLADTLELDVTKLLENSDPARDEQAEKDEILAEWLRHGNDGTSSGVPAHPDCSIDSLGNGRGGMNSWA